MGFVMIGGFFGAMLRYALSQWIAQLHQTGYPLGTAFLNFSGAFAIGICLQLHLNEWLLQLLVIGFLGAYTTFSTFSFEVIKLLEKGQHRKAAFTVIASFTFCLIATALGYFIAA